MSLSVFIRSKQVKIIAEKSIAAEIWSKHGTYSMLFILYICLYSLGTLCVKCKECHTSGKTKSTSTFFHIDEHTASGGFSAPEKRETACFCSQPDGTNLVSLRAKAPPPGHKVFSFFFFFFPCPIFVFHRKEVFFAGRERALVGWKTWPFDATPMRLEVRKTAAWKERGRREKMRASPTFKKMAL